LKSRLAFLLVACLAGGIPLRRAQAQSAPDEKKASAPADATVEKLVADLGADDYRARDTAQKKLVALGKKALPALQKAERESADAEVRARAHEAIAAITKDSPNDSPSRERKGELEPDQPKVEEDEDEPRAPTIPRSPRLNDFFRGNHDMDEFPDAVKKMLEQIQKQFDSLDRQAERELRRPQPNQNGVRIQITSRPKTPVELKLGLSLNPPGPALAAQLDLSGTDGGLVAEDLVTNFPAWKIGLKPYDVVLSLDGKPVRTPFDLAGLGERDAKLEVVRKAKHETILVHKLDDAPVPQVERKRPDPGAPGNDDPSGPTRKF
jgi:hypothetical protein